MNISYRCERTTPLYKLNVFLSVILVIVLFTRGFHAISWVYYISYPIYIYLFFDLIMDVIGKVKKNNWLLLNCKKLLPSGNFAVLLFLLFGIWSIITTIWSSIQTVTFQRSVFFVVLFIASLNAGSYLKNELNIFWKVFFFINIVLLSVNLFSLFSGIPGLPVKGYKYFGFMGFLNHPNKLAQYLFISFSLALSGLIAFNNTFFKKKTNLLLIILWILTNIFLLIKTNSRASLLSLVLLFLIFIFFYNSHKIFRMLIPAFFILLLFILFYPGIRHNFLEYIYKHDHNNLFASRELLIKNSFDAAFEGGICGLGYGMSSIKFVSPELGDFRADDYFQREKTVSLFAIIEETGLIGLLFFISAILNFTFYLIYSLRQNFIPEQKLFITFILSFIIALNIYAQIESWWIGLGSLPLPLFFLLVGMSTPETSHLRKVSTVHELKFHR